jgi:hypothetical protein
VFGYTAVGVAVSFAMFAAIRSLSKGSPRTMTQEYQEATNELLKVRCCPNWPARIASLAAYVYQDPC